ncbi:MAG: hypothetical protein QME79_12545 [Bacillota bacterium]|nr:hypothetical protein [Bacillota bacterium]
MSGEIEVEGLGETLANLDRFVQVLEEELTQAVQFCVDLVVNDARSTDAFHDRTGNLRNSIQGEVERIAEGVIEGVVWPGMEYGKYLELGTSKMAPHSFLGPALEKNYDRIVRTLAAAVERAKARCAIR